MPVIPKSAYRPPVFFTNPHVQTIFPTLFRKVTGIRYERERIDTPDADFLDLDWSRVGSERLAIVLHGLEGDSTRSYMLGMVKALNNGGWDALAMNFRACSGECNRALRFYHSGETSDLHTVIGRVVERNLYSQLALVGFSLGGNVILKYLGERAEQIHPLIRRAVVFSVPCDLEACAVRLAEFRNRLYLKRFLRMLHEKIRMKMALMPDKINDHGYRQIKDFADYDDRYTAPIHGFRDAKDYWEKASSRQYLPKIAVPTLLVNSADDPFLAGSCYPVEEAKASDALVLEIPQHGGHVGFVALGGSGEYWSESRAVAFLQS